MTQTASPLTRRLLQTAALLLVGCLSACGSDMPEAAFDTYLSRLERTLDTVRQPTMPAAVLPELPRSARLQLEFPGSKLDALDFLALSGCALQVTIGKRNSSLGRMAGASQRLLLELEYLQLAPACVTRLRQQERGTLADLLEEVWHQKRAQLPGRIFNATLASAEYRAFWQPPARLAEYPDHTSSAVVTALADINASARRWLAGDYRFDNLGFELLLSEVAAGDGGALLKAEALQAQWLEATDRLLADRIQRQQGLSFNRNSDEMTIVKNVVTKFFIGGIQPWLVAVDRRRQLLLPEVRALEQLLGATLPPHYRQWQQTRDRSLQHWSAGAKRHVANLKALQSALEP